MGDRAPGARVRARLALDRARAVATIDPRLFGAFVEHLGRAVYGGLYEPGHPAADGQGFRTDVLDLVRGLAPPVVRYPGGNFVSAYRWEDGVGPRGRRPVRLDPAWRTRETNQVGTDEFVAWCRAAGAEPMLAVNLGTRGIDAACALLEYCNHPGGTAWSDLRRRHGHARPHGVRLWCLGNEMDGPWQVGHKTAHEYGRLASETAKAMRAFDQGLELVACGSSFAGMPTFGAWEETVLELCAGAVDHVSLHAYFDDEAGDAAAFLAQPVALERAIRAVGAVIDRVQARTGAARPVHVAVDEWNVWYHNRRQDKERLRTWDWPTAPALLEEAYDVTDALVVACALNALIRSADRVRIACLAQLVNVIAPIMTVTGGPAWRQTTYHPLQAAARHARGTSLAVALDCPAYDGGPTPDVPWLDAAAADTGDGLALFLVNRHAADAIDLAVSFAGFAPRGVALHRTLSDPDPRATNTAAHPDRVTLRAGTGAALQDGALHALLPPRSYHVLRLAP